MAKNILFAALISILLLSTHAADAPPCVSCVYLKELGVREATGHNDGERVEQYQKSTKNRSGDSWCASFVKWCFDQAKVKTTITGWSPSAQNSRNLVYAKGVFIKEPQEADVFTIYSISQKRIHHTGFFHRRINEAIYETVEGNTNVDGSSNGNGVYMRRRSFHATYTISRWL